ncbi:MAG: hypothetical protein O3C10_00940 [Chloroflexi bacterium]|nr:hypothetical protein [Chloroflexota bacterium]
MRNGTPTGSTAAAEATGAGERFELPRRSFRLHKAHDGMRLLSAGVPAILLHGAGGVGGWVDELITFGLLGGLVIGLVLLSFRGARNKNKRRNRRDKGRSRR